ncbi:MAG: hypothetical protein QOJ29_3438 [Thermoleophilaceae bacterium]|jgi:hypothetical protein|nr:hypothetical protein [Thermoleophilaceae bacterium]
MTQHHQPFRPLHKTSPLTHGPDVEALQSGVNARLGARNLAKIHVDGQYGPTTSSAVRSVLFALGAPQAEVEAGATITAQKIIRDPKQRPQSWLKRAEERKKLRARKGNEVDALLKWAHSKVGMHESPPDSNRGPEIDKYNRECGTLAAPYCAEFVVYGLRHICEIHVPSEWRYSPNIWTDAKAGRYGFRAASKETRPEPGWVVLMDFVAGGDPVMHVGFVDDPIDHHVEANTSSDQHGSQDNGGGVYIKTRTERLPFIVGYAVPPFGA